MTDFFDDEFDKVLLEEPSKSIFQILSVNVGKYGKTGDNLLFPVNIEVENKQLKGIHIHYTGEAHLLEPLVELPCLEWLELYLYDKENQLFLPKSLDKLKYLKELNLSGNRLTKIPNEIFKLKWLEDIKLDINRLEKLDSNIGAMTSLKKLYLNDNKLTRLPDEIGELKNLKILKLTKN